MEYGMKGSHLNVIFMKGSQWNNYTCYYVVKFAILCTKHNAKYL